MNVLFRQNASQNSRASYSYSQPYLNKQKASALNKKLEMGKENCRQLSSIQLFCTDSTTILAYNTTEDMLSVKPHKTYIKEDRTVVKHKES